MAESKSDLSILLLGGLTSMRSMTRFQKMAFLADKEVFEKDEYTDWKPHYYGPFSRDLENDIENYSKKGLLKSEKRRHPISNEPVSCYMLTDEGKEKFNSLCSNKKYVSYIEKIKKRFFRYQFHKTNAILLSYVYKNYPDYTVNSKIKNEI